MDIAYVAQTETCTFLLDAQGICVSCIAGPNADAAARATAARCVGAQYVASLDTGIEGLLVRDPVPGRSLLFASVDENRRVALLRTGPLLDMRSTKSVWSERDDELPATMRQVPRESALFPVQRAGARAHVEEDIPLPPETRRVPETLRDYPPPEARPQLRRVSRG